MRPLYEIDSDLARVMGDMAADMEEHGEISDETVALLEALNLEKDAKIEGMVLWVKDLNARLDAAKAEKARISKIISSGEREVEWLKARIAQELEGKKFATERASVSYRTTHNCLDLDKDKAAAIPAQYRKVGDPDKTLIKEALLAGEVIEGATLSDHTSVIIK